MEDIVAIQINLKHAESNLDDEEDLNAFNDTSSKLNSDNVQNQEFSKVKTKKNKVRKRAPYGDN